MKKTLKMFADLLLAIEEEDGESERLYEMTSKFINVLQENEEEALQWVKMRNSLDGMFIKGLWSEEDKT